MDHGASFRVPADAYDRHVGRYSPALARDLCDLAAVRPGDRALDVGCGPGALAAELATRLGSPHVAAVDPSVPFADACRARLPGVDVRVAAADALPFADGDFDVVVSQLVVNFLPDAPAGLAEIRRVTRPGGTIAAAVWDYRGEMRLLRAYWDAAAVVDPATRSADEARSMSYITLDSLEELWTGTGLDGIRVGSTVVAADYSGFADLWAPLQAGVGPAGAHLLGLDPPLQVALADEMRRRLDVGDTPFRLTARAWLVVGLVP